MTFRFSDILVFVAFILGLVLGGGAVNSHWQKKWDAHVAADQAAVNEAVARAVATEKKQAKADVAAAVSEAKAQERIIVRTRTIIERIPDHVSNDSHCITYGLVRVLDAAALGVDPADLELPPGKSDDACAPVEATTLAGSVVDNYGTARQNAQQLDALIADSRARIDLFNQGATTP